jgi:HlyD family secretion protein
MKKILGLVIVLAVLGAAGYWYWKGWATPRSTFNVTEVKRGRLEATVGSTGTLQPREVVDVGAQVVGRIIFIGKDSYTKSGIVDWGSKVEGPTVDKDGNGAKKGTVLAQIDPDLYTAQVEAAKASVASAEASVQAAEATVQSAEAAVETAEATVASAQADLLQKKATLEQATADWSRSQTLARADKGGKVSRDAGVA